MRIHLSLSSAALFYLAIGVAEAATVTPLFTRTEVSIDGISSIDGLGFGSGFVFDESDLPTSFDTDSIAAEDYAATVTAFQNQTGFSQISLDITSPGDVAADAVAGHSLFARSHLGLEFTNDGAVPEAVRFDFSLSGMSLNTVNAAFNPGPSAELVFTAREVNGGTALFHANAKLTGTFNAPTVSATNFSGGLTRTRCVTSDTCYGADYQIEDLNHFLDLGILNPGERTVVTIVLVGVSNFDGFEMGGEVFATDPSGTLSYSVSSTPTGPLVAPVPLPAGLPLGLTGLVMFRFLKRRM